MKKKIQKAVYSEKQLEELKAKGYRLNSLGVLVKFAEVADPVPVASKVAFKRPLSANERVMRAIRQRDLINAMNAAPGDTDFDAPDFESMTPHQLMEDPDTGKEMTAGEYVMLRHEREQAKTDVAAELARKKKLKDEAFAAAKAELKKNKKGAGAPIESEENSDE